MGESVAAIAVNRARACANQGISCNHRRGLACTWGSVRDLRIAVRIPLYLRRRGCSCDIDRSGCRYINDKIHVHVFPTAVRSLTKNWPARLERMAWRFLSIRD